MTHRCVCSEVRQLAQLRVQRLQTVGGLQTDPEGVEEAEAMEGAGLLPPLLQAGHGRDVHLPEVMSEPEQRSPGLRPGRVS